MLVKNKSNRVKVDVGVIPVKKINDFSGKIIKYLNGEYHPDFEPDLAYRYIMANKLARQQKRELDAIIKENEIKEVANSVVNNGQGGEE